MDRNFIFLLPARWNDGKKSLDLGMKAKSLEIPLKLHWESQRLFFFFLKYLPAVEF